MFSYCPDNSSIFPAWQKYGLTRCFLETFSGAFLVVWISLFGCVQIARRAQIRKLMASNSNNVVTSPSVFKGIDYFQIILHLALPIIECVVFILRLASVVQPPVAGLWLFRLCSRGISWLAALYLLQMEKDPQLYHDKYHRHITVSFWSVAFILNGCALVSWNNPDWWWDVSSVSSDVELSFWCLRQCCLTAVLIVGVITSNRRQKERWAQYKNLNESSSSSLNEQQSSTRNPSTWKSLFRKLRLMAPMVWPTGSIPLQIAVVLCLGIMVAGRVINPFVPIYYKHIVDTLPERFCWDYILVWILLRFLQGGGVVSMSLFGMMRSLLWINVQQYTSKAVQIKLFAHVHRLSMRWHLNRKMGELLKIMDRGTSSINNILNYVVFQIAPAVADIIIAVVYFLSAFNIYFGLVVMGTMALYLAVTIAITEWRTKYRRSMNTLDNERNAISVDSLLNFETVKLYDAAKFEEVRFGDAIDTYQRAAWKSVASLSILTGAQSFVISAGLLGGALLCAYYLTAEIPVNGRLLTVGDFVLFVTYVLQLYSPLNFFGTYYRMIQAAFIDMENMFELLDEPEDVKDVEGAEPLQLHSDRPGCIQFDDVRFSYLPEKQILRGVSFEVPPGETYALVGPSGAGKSTVTRLLLRFYELQSGCIRIDGQDISQITQESLRQCIGVVPQDTVLFNADVKYNIRYGRQGATDSEVEDAAMAAAMHESILNFPSGYETKVGERGLKVSGGEKQRVAIARTILKSPAIVLLDEATSALDTQTERNIQESLSKICENRTTLVVAHRLSTIIHAHNILVLSEGLVVESGSHEALLAKGGLYHAMWFQQLAGLGKSASGEGLAATEPPLSPSIPAGAQQKGAKKED